MAAMAKPTHASLPHRLLRLARTRWRLFLSGAIGIVCIGIFLLATEWRVVTSMLVGWDIGGERVVSAAPALPR
jgi:hypothetical protein